MAISLGIYPIFRQTHIAFRCTRKPRLKSTTQNRLTSAGRIVLFSQPALHHQIQVQIAFRPTANGKNSDVGGAILAVHAEMDLVEFKLVSAGTTVLPSIGLGHVEAGHIVLANGDHAGFVHHGPLCS